MDWRTMRWVFYSKSCVCTVKSPSCVKQPGVLVKVRDSEGKTTETLSGEDEVYSLL